MSWKQAYRSMYYQGAPEPEDMVLDPVETALLVIDIQNEYMERPDRDTLSPDELAQYDAWTPFHERMWNSVIPNTKRALADFRERGVECLFARIACLKEDGRDRSLSQKKPGWNYLLMPHTTHKSQLLSEVGPINGEIEVCKTTDSALTGTNLRLVLPNMGIKNVVLAGIFTDQCVSSTVRSLADESYNVIVLEDCCAAATDDLHYKELEIINMIYCHVMQYDELKPMLDKAN
ncbi:MAG: cysteine hydrolase family protein [Alphaproteobacteria bacterium]|nr:cysteine hydrolase family protein [Alphaproteobacteria bacterium]